MLLRAWLNSNEYQSLLNILKSRDAKTILDVGCGNGWLVHSLRRDGFDVHGIDRKETYQGADYITQADARDLPCAAESFDVVILFAVLHSVDTDDRKRLVSESLRVCKRDGFVVIVDYPDQLIRREKCNAIFNVLAGAEEYLIGLADRAHYLNYQNYGRSLLADCIPPSANIAYMPPPQKSRLIFHTVRIER